MDEALEHASGQVNQVLDFLDSEIDNILHEAGKRLDHSFKDWNSFDRFVVPVQLARGIRPDLTQADLEELERQRPRGFSWLCPDGKPAA